jgi:hypothetical protein
MTVVKNYTHKRRLRDYTDESLVLDSKIKEKSEFCKSVFFCNFLTSVL